MTDKGTDLEWGTIYNVQREVVGEIFYLYSISI